MNVSPESPAMATRSLRKVYGGTVALADVNIDVRPGEIHGLLGENGAGKSTLVRLMAGGKRRWGSLSFFGSGLPPRFSPDTVAQHGVVFIHQNLGVIDDLSVAENIALASGYVHKGPFISWVGTRRRAMKALQTMGVDIHPDTRVGDLPMALRSVTAIARALMQDVRLLVLDEPTATSARMKWTPSSRSCGGCAIKASPSSSSPTGWTKCWPSRIE
ncbi:MAG: sugar ABC transporter ATP-binding protein [Acidimicrobiaceae bacterium]|nr:sugar ABC transporter ATP-binding protein [Acidimicrobiaceae bacterium]